MRLAIFAVLGVLFLAGCFESTAPANVPIGLVMQTSVDSGVAPLTVTFTPVGDYLTKNTVISYTWNFGGSPIITSESSAPRQMTFSNPGDYTVTLTATTSTGETKVVIKVIHVTSVSQPQPQNQSNMKSFDLTANDALFNPHSIAVKKGDNVTINFHNDGANTYFAGLDVRSDYFNVKMANGGSVSANFLADNPFTFSSYWPTTGVHKADGRVEVS